MKLEDYIKKESKDARQYGSTKEVKRIIDLTKRAKKMIKDLERSTQGIELLDLAKTDEDKKEVIEAKKHIKVIKDNLNELYKILSNVMGKN